MCTEVSGIEVIFFASSSQNLVHLACEDVCFSVILSLFHSMRGLLPFKFKFPLLRQTHSWQLLFSTNKKKTSTTTLKKGNHKLNSFSNERPMIWVNCARYCAQAQNTNQEHTSLARKKNCAHSRYIFPHETFISLLTNTLAGATVWSTVFCWLSRLAYSVGTINILRLNSEHFTVYYNCSNF